MSIIFHYCWQECSFLHFVPQVFFFRDIPFGIAPYYEEIIVYMESGAWRTWRREERLWG